MNTVAKMLKPTSSKCACFRNCQFKPPLALFEILNLRNSFYQQPTESAANAYLADIVRHQTPAKQMVQDCSSGDHSQARRDMRRDYVYKLLGKEMCGTYFREVFGCSKNKMATVRKLVNLGDTGVLARARPEVQVSPEVRYNQSWGFWNSFFAKCQRPNDFVRIFPVNLGMEDIYDEYFTPWYNAVLSSDACPLPPALTTFKRARWDPAFHDVKKRAGHYHARCQTCSNLQARKLKGFIDGHEQAQYVKERQLHDDTVKSWRKREEAEKLEARHSPRDQLTLFFDDTSALGFPKFTNRAPKNLTTSRFDMIPFVIMDEARQKTTYIYTAKNRFKKGANRLCTELFHQLHAIKTGTHAAKFARKCVLIADNYSENQNNTNLGFLADLVANDWFDVIEFLYGPVGHTHNGGDAVHHIHNDICGNFTSPTLPHFVNRFPQAWRTEATRPDVAILDVQYDWDKYYNPVIDTLSGFIKTDLDVATVRAWQIKKGPSGLVEVKLKRDPSFGDWLGVAGTSESPGYHILKGPPHGVPLVVPPEKNIMPTKYYTQLVGAGMRACLEAEGCPEALEWLSEAAKHGVVPIDKELEDATPPGELGPLVQLRCGEITAQVRVVRQHPGATRSEFFALPEDVRTAYVTTAQMQARLDIVHAAPPCVGYSRVKPVDRPSYPGSRYQLDKDSGASKLRVNAKKKKQSDRPVPRASAPKGSTRSKRKLNPPPASPDSSEVDNDASESHSEDKSWVETTRRVVKKSRAVGKVVRSGRKCLAKHKAILEKDRIEPGGFCVMACAYSGADSYDGRQEAGIIVVKVIAGLAVLLLAVRPSYPLRSLCSVLGQDGGSGRVHH